MSKQQKSYSLQRSILIALSCATTMSPVWAANVNQDTNDSGQQVRATAQEKARGFTDKDIVKMRKQLEGINPNRKTSPSKANTRSVKGQTSKIVAVNNLAMNNGVAITGLSGASGSETFYTFNVPAGTHTLIFEMSGGSGDADMYVLFGGQPSSGNYECRPYVSGNNETCNISNIQAGTYHVMLQGYSAYADASLTATYQNGPIVLPPHRLAVAGDSITKAFSADCTSNYSWWDLLCPAGGDQEHHSWFDGSASSVNSVFDRFHAIDNTSLSNQSAAQSGSEMRGGNNNFVVQANHIVNQADQPNNVTVVLGGNDLCNRGCVDGQDCADPIYTDQQWRESVQSGLDILMAGMPADSSVLLGSVPRVQDIRQAGKDLQAQKPWDVDCDYIWTNYDVCSIVTADGTYNNETVAERHTGVAAAQKRYNAILAEEATAYNSNANGRNPNGIVVASEYVNEATPSAGTFAFGSEHINGGDCFHPNVATQNLISDFMYNANPSKP